MAAVVVTVVPADSGAAAVATARADLAAAAGVITPVDLAAAVAANQSGGTGGNGRSVLLKAAMALL